MRNRHARSGLKFRCWAATGGILLNYRRLAARQRCADGASYNGYINTPGTGAGVALGNVDQDPSVDGIVAFPGLAEIDTRARLAFSAGTRIAPAGLGDRGPLVGAAAVGWRGLEE